MVNRVIPVALGAQIRRHYDTTTCSPVAMPATDRYGRRGYFVMTSDNDETGTFYFVRKHGFYAFGHVLSSSIAFE